MNDYSNISNYEIKDTIGEGNFGKVKLAIFKSTGEEFAVKILNKKKIKEKMNNVFFNENEIIKKFNHINVIYVYQLIEKPDNYYIIMEYCSKGELFDYIVKNKRLNEKESSIFFYQLINGLQHIHKKKVAHRDLKPENLLLTENNILKIIDFGLSHIISNKKLLKTKCGSPSYASPEIITRKFYNGFKNDIWCCGIILYAMLCGYLPFEGENNDELFKNILICKPELPDFLSEKAKKLIIKILNPNPDERIYIDEIKKDDFYLMGKELSNIDYDTIEKSIIHNRSISKNQDFKNIIKNIKDGIKDNNNIKDGDYNNINNNKDSNKNINNNNDSNNNKKDNNNNNIIKKDCNYNSNEKKENNNHINKNINKKDINGYSKGFDIYKLNKKLQILNNHFNFKIKKSSKKILNILQTDSIIHNRNLSVNHNHNHNHSNSININSTTTNNNKTSYNNINIQTRNKKRNYVFSATSIKKTKNEIQTINNGFFREFSPKYSLKELIEMKKNKKNLRLLNYSNLVFHNLNFNHNSLNEGSKNKIIKTTLNSFEHQLILSKKNRLKKSVSNNSKKNNNNKSTNQNNSNINKKRNLNLFMNNITSNIKINKRKKNSINGSIISNISINTNPNFSNIHNKSSSRDEKYIPKTTRKEVFNQFKFIKYHF
jgi:serine/threonine protein kinase